MSGFPAILCEFNPAGRVHFGLPGLWQVLNQSQIKVLLCLALFRKISYFVNFPSTKIQDIFEGVQVLPHTIGGPLLKSWITEVGLRLYLQLQCVDSWWWRWFCSLGWCTTGVRIRRVGDSWSGFCFLLFLFLDVFNQSVFLVFLLYCFLCACVWLLLLLLFFRYIYLCSSCVFFYFAFLLSFVVLLYCLLFVGLCGFCCFLVAHAGLCGISTGFCRLQVAGGVILHARVKDYALDGLPHAHQLDDFGIQYEDPGEGVSGRWASCRKGRQRNWIEQLSQFLLMHGGPKKSAIFWVGSLPPKKRIPQTEVVSKDSGRFQCDHDFTKLIRKVMGYKLQRLGWLKRWFTTHNLKHWSETCWNICGGTFRMCQRKVGREESRLVTQLLSTSI